MNKNLKIFHILALFSMILNIVNPFLVSGIFLVRAEEVTESSESEKIEQTAEEPKESKSNTEELKDYLDEKIIVKTEQEQEQEGDILEEGIMDYRGEEDISNISTTASTEIKVEQELIQEELQIEETPEQNTCVSEKNEITESSKEMWDLNENTAETKDNVKTGVKYIFPLEEEVTITFKCLPSENSKLKIEKIRVSDLNLPGNFKTDAEYAYDISTTMDNGTFSYDITLPKPENTEVEVVYIEKSVDEAKKEIKEEDIKTLDKEALNQSTEDTDVKVENLNHFTIFIPTYTAALTITEIPNNVKLSQWETKSNGKWITGHLGSSNSNYAEGETVPFELDMGKLVAGTYTFSVCRDYQDSSKYGYWKIEPYNTTKNPTTSEPITNTNSVFSGSNIVIDSVDEVGGQGACGAGQRETKVIFTTLGNVDTYIYWGGYLAAPSDVGFGNSASNYPGSSLSMRIIPAKNLPIDTKAIIPILPAEITVNKIVDTGTEPASSWCFNISPNPNNESLPLCPELGQNSVTFSNLTTGSYEITETNTVNGYTFISGEGTNCTFSENIGTATVASATSPANASCTFHNAKEEPKTGTLIVKKVVINNNGGTLNPQDFSFMIGNTGPVTFESDGQNEITLTPGTYSVTEVSKAGYTPSYNNCSDITITAGEITTCTITNNDEQPKIIVYKNVIGGDKNPEDFTINVTGNNISNSSFQGENTGTTVFMDAGTYSVAEIIQDGYTPTYSEGCSSTLVTGDTKTCTITNTRQTGYLKVIKVTDDSSDLTQWSFSLNGQTAVQADKNGIVEFGQIDTGDNYTIIEFGPTEYTLTSVNGNNCTPDINNNGATARVDAGETTTCTFNNSINKGSITIIKNATPDDETNFNFVTSGSGISNFTLDDDGDTTNTYSNTKTFSGLFPGDYSITESVMTNWKQEEVVCNSDQEIETTTGNGTVSIKLKPNENLTCTFLNVKETGRILGYKYEDKDLSNTLTEGDVALSEWTIYIDTNGNKILDSEEPYTLTNENGKYTFENLNPDTYTICEIQKSNWHEVDNTCYEAIVKSNSETTLNFFNYQLGSVMGYKFKDTNESGTYDETEEIIPNWNFYLEELNFSEGINSWNLIKTIKTDNNGKWYFNNLTPGKTYRVIEENKNGWKSTNIPDVTLGFSLTSGEKVEDIYFGNNVINPNIYISKFNNANSTKNIGDIVQYTITVRTENSAVNDVSVVDLLPNGFSYQGGSYKVESSTRGDLTGTVVGEPTYNSPGTWSLGDMTEGEELTLTYNVKIESFVDAGTYKDIALGNGINVTEDNIRAQAENPGYVATNFVGTEVEVEKETLITEDKVKVEIDEEEEEIIEEVLGASDVRLPATGASSWIYYTLILMFTTGMILSLYPMLKKGTKHLLIILLILIIIPTAHAEVETLMVRLEKPSSTYNSSFNLTYVALSNENEYITTTCYKKGPTDSDFIAFTTPKTLIKGGDTSNCIVGNNVLSEEGTYEFKVKAEATSGNVYSEVVETYYDGVGPDRPKRIEKDKKSACKYEITIETANDGETTYVEVYRSNDKNITTNESNRIKTITMGPNEESSFEYEVYSTECSKTFYFATRAFDNADNPSEPRSEEIKEVTQKTVKKEIKGEDEITEAIEIAQGGSILGERTTSQTEEENNKEEDTGEVLGENEETENTTENKEGFLDKLLQSKAFWLLLIVVGIIVFNDYRSKKKGIK